MDLCGPGQVPLAATCEELIFRFHKAGDFLNSCVTVSFSLRFPLHIIRLLVFGPYVSSTANVLV